MISSAFIKLFGKPPRDPENDISQFYMDIAASIQSVTEEIVIKLAKSLKKENKSNLRVILTDKTEEFLNLLIEAINALLYKSISLCPSKESPMKRYFVLPLEFGLPDK